MIRKEYAQAQLEIIELTSKDVLTESDKYEGWNPHSGSGSSDTNSGYEGWNPHPSGDSTNKYW